MDENTADIDGWRRVHLGDEPIYCSAPPPPKLDDIIHPGSDEELDESERVAKRLKYEAQALRYLQGKPVRILSASLRGPFDKASGWQNPWLPKQPAIKKSALKSSRLPIKPNLSFSKRLRKNSERLARRHGTARGTNNSMRCHLPSPESNCEFQPPSNASEIEKHSRIQAWAEEISKGAILERDTFWAPSKPLHEVRDETSKKRPARKEWLKKSSKRKRLGRSQNTTPGFTPTPIQTTQTPIRSTSMPPNLHRMKRPVLSNVKESISQLEASQSFESATPSSTMNPSRPEIMCERQIESSMQCGSAPSQDKSFGSTILDAGNTRMRSTSTTANGMPNRYPANSQEGERVSDSEMENYSQNPENSIHAETQQDQRAEGDTTLTSYIDESFHYRARPLKEITPETSPEFSTVNLSPKPTHTGTPPELCTSRESVAIAQATVQLLDLICSQRRDSGVQGHRRCPTSSAPKDEVFIGRKIEESGEGPSKRDETTNHSVVPETRPADEQKPHFEIPDPLQVGLTDVSTLSETTNALHIENQSTEGHGSGAIEPSLHILHAVHKTQYTGITVLPCDPAVIKATHINRFELLVDEESTLIDDPADINDAMPLEAGGLPTLDHISNNTCNTAETSIRNSTREDESDAESNPIAVPLSQLEWGVGGDTDEFQEKFRAITEDKTEILALKVERNPEEEASVVLQQSPWAPNLPSGANLTVEHIKSEPVNEEATHPACLSNPTLLDSHASRHETPGIRPSQQSPWGGELLEPVKLYKQLHQSPTRIRPITTDASPVTTISERHQSPWTGTNTSMALHSSKYPPVSPTTVVPDEESLSACPQPSTTSHGPRRRLSGNGINSPATPPPAPISDVHSPNLEKLIKPFSIFNTPSPKRQPRQSICQYSSIGRTLDIPSKATHSNPGTNRPRTRRVSFAPSPNEGDNDNATPTLNAKRPASPPPKITLDAGDEDVDNLFQSHFDAVKRRATGEPVRFRQHPRLLPSFSQQKPVSPPVGAMANAFREADACLASSREDPLADAENADPNMPNVEQSPWRKESQEIDHVADVMEHLDDFLNTWDINVELQKTKQESSMGNLGWGELA